MQDDPEKIVEAIEKGFQKHKQDEECFDQNLAMITISQLEQNRMESPTGWVEKSKP